MTHAAYESDEAGAEKMEAGQAEMGMAKPPVQYVDGAYVSGQMLAEAEAERRSLIGPVAAAPNNNGGRYRTEDFDVIACCQMGWSARISASGKRSEQFQSWP